MPLGDRLAALARGRVGGAVNIRGISFQLLATLRELLRMCADEHVERVRPEGIEDIDVHRLGCQRTYTQVKTSTRPWNVSNLRGVVDGFLPLWVEDPECSLVLLLDREPGQDVRYLIGPHDEKGKRRAVARFTELCRDAMAAKAVVTDAARPTHALAPAPADEVAAWLLNRMHFKWVSEEHLRREVLALMHDQFGVAGEHVEEILLALSARTMDAAQERRELVAADVRAWYAAAVEAAGELRAMADVGLLVTRASWDEEVRLDDFWAGKAARPGHVAAGADVRRPTWLDRIDRAWPATFVCVVRSASGQGKTTLALRYAYDRWPRDDTYLLRSCATAGEAEQVNRWLGFRAKLGLPTLLIAEGDSDCRRWPLVASRCASLRVPLLVAVRREDWIRYAQPSGFNYELVDPELTLAEAREIHAALRGGARLHPAAPPPERAFERAGRDGGRPMLLEFVHLLTQGRTLAERLTEQVQAVNRLGEDPAKLAIVRLAVVAHGLGVAVDPARLSEVIAFRSDPELTLGEVDGEYVSASPARLSGLHHVRSEALRVILHGPAWPQTDTAVCVLRLIGDDQLMAFAATGLQDLALDAERLLDALAARAAAGGPSSALAILDGCFEAGESGFLKANASAFDQAAREGGAFAASTLIAGEVLPIIPTKFLQAMLESEALGQSEGLRSWAALASRLDRGAPRGLDMCRGLLERVTRDHGGVNRLLRGSTPRDTGALLDWHHLCSLTLPRPEDWLPTVWGSPALDLPMPDFATLAQGVGRAAQTWFTDWVRANEADVRAYLMLALDCTEIRFDWDTALPAVAATFIPDGDGDGYRQAMHRLGGLRRALPTFGRFACRGDWSFVPLLDELPWVAENDETVKDVPARNLHLASDVSKNVVFSRLVQARYTADTYHEFEALWRALRLSALAWCRAADRVLRLWLEGRRDGVHHASAQLADATVKFRHDLRPFPIELPPQSPSRLREVFGASREFRSRPNAWHQHLGALANQFTDLVVQEKTFTDARRAATNAADAAAALSAVHEAFVALKADGGPDYFDEFETLPPDERVALEALTDAAMVAVARRRFGGGTMAETRRRAREHGRAVIRSQGARIREARSDEAGPRVLPEPPVDQLPGVDDGRFPALRDSVLTMYPIVFEVSDPTSWAACDLPALVSRLREAGELAEWFVLFPMFGGRPLLAGTSLSVAGFRLQSLDADVARHLLPTPVPVELVGLIPATDSPTPPPFARAAALLAVADRTAECVGRLHRVLACDPPSTKFATALAGRYDARVADLRARARALAEEAKEIGRMLDDSGAAGSRRGEVLAMADSVFRRLSDEPTSTG